MGSLFASPRGAPGRLDPALSIPDRHGAHHRIGSPDPADPLEKRVVARRGFEKQWRDVLG